MSKELNVLQAIEMPVGTEFKVIRDNGKVNGSKAILDMDYYYKFLKWDDGQWLKITSKNLNSKFIPIQKPMSFMEAVKSGCKIKVEHNLIDDVLLNKKDIYFRSDSSHNRKALERFRNKEFMPLNFLFSALGYLFDNLEIAEIIADGKWYIEEE